MARTQGSDWPAEQTAELKRLRAVCTPYPAAAAALNAKFGTSRTAKACASHLWDFGQRTGTNSRGTWPQERIEELTRLWADGHSVTRIGAAMGLSRNAVIGKVHRLGLPEPDAKLPVIFDRTYIRQAAEVTKAHAIAKWRRYREKQRLSLDTKRAIRARFLANGATKTSREYRRHMPPLEVTSKNQLRAMLAQAVQNTAAMGEAA